MDASSDFKHALVQDRVQRFDKMAAQVRIVNP